MCTKCVHESRRQPVDSLPHSAQRLSRRDGTRRSVVKEQDEGVILDRDQDSLWAASIDRQRWRRFGIDPSPYWLVRPPGQFPGELFHRSEEHTSELQSLMRISYAVFCLKKT